MTTNTVNSSTPTMPAEWIVPAGELWQAPNGEVSRAAADTALPPGGRVVLTMWYAGTLLQRRDGHLEVSPLTPLLGSAAEAQAVADAMHAPSGPIGGAHVFACGLSYDPRCPEDVAELRHMVKAVCKDFEALQ